MEKEQELEWLEAQKIVVSEDLIGAAKQQLQFLATVDKNRCLHDGPVMYYAIYRYKACWLPLLAKQYESWISGTRLAGFPCEWIWHCHRLNPYKEDCKEFMGGSLTIVMLYQPFKVLPQKKLKKIGTDCILKSHTSLTWASLYQKILMKSF